MDAIGFIAMKRSGHHAVINWFQQNCSEKSVFFNNVGCWSVGDRAKSVIQDEDPELLIYNIEDRTVEDSKEMSSVFFEDLGVKPKNTRLVLVVRDAYNCFASRLKGEVSKKTPDQVRDLWASHVNDYTNDLSLSVRINYNKWFSSVGSRVDYAKLLEVEYSEKGTSTVPTQGSSFDGMSYNGKAQKMNVLRRYRGYIYDEVYVRTVSSEIELLNKAIFDMPCILMK